VRIVPNDAAGTADNIGNISDTPLPGLTTS
jgi:hypothetical protein